jgi:hypothetical protein
MAKSEVGLYIKAMRRESTARSGGAAMANSEVGPYIKAGAR